LNKALVSVKTILDECLSVLIFKAQEKGIELSLIEGCSNEIAIVTDGNRVKQIIINLLSNAIKYTVQGYVRIYVLIEEDKMELVGGFVKIKVEDSGVGMTNRQKARLFQPFTKI
jgi:two-component system, NarL family, sensor histidine kinase EvgS